MIQWGKNHSRWWMNKTTHDIYYWKVLIVFTCTVFVDWKSSSRGSCRGHGENFLLHTAVLSFTHPYVPYSSTQHFCKIIRSPSYSNYNRPICEEVMVKSRNITSDLIITEKILWSMTATVARPLFNLSAYMMSYSNQPWVTWPLTLTYNSRLHDCLLVIVHMIKCNYVMQDRRGWLHMQIFQWCHYCYILNSITLNQYI